MVAHGGARVTAVDRSQSRLARLTENLVRLSLSAETVVADATQWQAEPFDRILLDAPCSSTGTIRRHPDISWLKTESDLPALMTFLHRRGVRAYVTFNTLVFTDERLTTAGAERALLEADASRARRAEVIDAAAAAWMLQGVLDRLRAR